MQLEIVNIVKENDYYIVKLNNDKYLRLGQYELAYLMKKVECNSSVDLNIEIEVRNIPNSIKAVIDKKIQEYSNIKSSSRFEGGLSMIKLVTVNPDKFLNSIYKFCGYFFSLPSVIVYVILNVLAFGLMGESNNNQRLIDDLSNLEINISTIAFLYVSLSITLMLHEIGHAIVCRKYGGKVTKMGIALFFLLPCMYCDVSDVYILQNRKRKLYVSVSGLYVNSFLSVVSIILYFVLRPSVVVGNFLLFYYVANVGFVIYNLIPFVKLDGYWLLSSILNINNLYTKSIICSIVAIFDRKLLKKATVSKRKRNVMIIFGVCSIFFRPIFWSFTLISIKQQLENGLNSNVINIGVGIIAVIVVIDLIKFYKDVYIKYNTQRQSIVNFL